MSRLKGGGDLDDIEEPVVKICWNYLDNEKEKENTKKYHFHGQYARLNGWFDLDQEWLEKPFCIRESDFYTIFFKLILEIKR